MNDPWIIWLVLITGLGVGVLVAWLFIPARRRDGATSSMVTRSIPRGAAQVLDLLATASIVIDERNRIVRCTDSAQRFGLYKDRLLVDRTLVELAQLARRSDGPIDKEVELDTSLDTANVSARAAKLGDSWVLIVLEDLTEARRLDETRRDFVANISHELKTPIGAVSLLSEALMDAKDDPATVERFAGNLYRESRRLGHLVQDIIQLSRLQSSDVLAKAKVIDLTSVIAEAVDANSLTAENRRVTLAVDAPSGIEVFADFDMLTTAVRNLIENAILYSDEGSQVGVGLRVNDDTAEISVTDSGVGISPEDQERIFERFYRVDPSRSRDTGGTGLGLAIVKHVVNLHRGEISVFSRPGIGSTFTIRIPLASTISNETKDE